MPATISSITRDQWPLLRRTVHGLTIAGLLTDFEDARRSCVYSQHGGTWDLGTGTHFETTGKGLRVLGRRPAKIPDGRLDAAAWKAWQAANPEPILLELPWSTVKAWATSQPSHVVEHARALQREWGAICKLRASYWDPANQCGPGWEETHTHPLTWRASVEVEARAREKALDRDVKAWVDSLAPEPADLLELLAVS